MNRRKGVPDWAIMAVCAFISAVLFGTGILNTQKVWNDPKLDWENGTEYTSTDGYGVKSAGPYLELPAGEYRLKWKIEGDCENGIHFSCSNDARIVPETVKVIPGQTDGEATIELLDPAHSFSIGVEFAEGEAMRCSSLRLYSPEYRDHAFTVSALLFLLAGYWIARRRGWMTTERRNVVLVLGMAALMACVPSLQRDTTGGWDVQFHAARIMNLMDSLRAGQFPARVGGFSYNGYGAATSVFYPDLWLYPAALMMCMGASMSYTINALVIALSALTAWMMYRAARSMGGTREMASASTALYTLCGYRIQDAYGGSLLLGEMLGMAFLPLLLAGLWQVFFGDKERWPKLVLAAMLLWHAHVLTTAFGAGLALAMLLTAVPELRKQPMRLKELGLACLFALLMGLQRLVPLADLYLSGVNTQVMQFGLAGSAVQPKALLLMNGRVGVALWLGAAACAIALTGEENRLQGRMLKSGLIFGAVCAWLSTQMFPWNYAVKALKAVEIIQFPWRFLLLTAVCFSLCGGYGFSKLFSGANNRAAFTALLVAVLAVSPVLKDMMEGARGVAFGEGANPYMVYPEYQLEGTDVNETRSRQPETGDGVTLADYEKNGTRIRGQVDAEAGGEITFPLFGFKGYEARLNGEKIAWRLGENNRLTVLLPAGAKGQLTVDWKTPALWRVCDLSSLAAAISLGVYCIKRRREH